MNFDIVGVGNALVDETYYVQRDFVDSTGLPFNHFHPLTHEEQEKIIDSVPDGSGPEIVCGGSTTNSLAAAANYGSICGHICQLGADAKGQLYENDLSQNEIISLNQFHHTSFKTGRCLVLITPNSERTMGTYLGASEQLKFDPIFIEHVNQAKILFSEGYQFTSTENYEAFIRILKSAKSHVKFALSLSDPFVIENFRDRVENVINLKRIDYLFCNLEEAKSLVGEDFINELPKIANNFVVTNGSESSTAYSNQEIQMIEPYKVKAIDSNGAGDIFAGSALHKIIQGDNFFEACRFGNFASSIIVQEKSPRLSKNKYAEIIRNFKSA